MRGREKDAGFIIGGEEVHFVEEGAVGGGGWRRRGWRRGRRRRRRRRIVGIGEGGIEVNRKLQGSGSRQRRGRGRCGGVHGGETVVDLGEE